MRRTEMRRTIHNLEVRREELVYSMDVGREERGLQYGTGFTAAYRRQGYETCDLLPLRAPTGAPGCHRVAITPGRGPHSQRPYGARSGFCGCSTNDFVANGATFSTALATGTEIAGFASGFVVLPQ